jgi:hypothetical protein
MSKASEANGKADSISMVCALVLGSHFPFDTAGA